MSDLEALKDWAWRWAQALAADISRTQEWFDAIKAQTPAETGGGQRAVETACIRATTAYFEYLRGNWSRERAEREMADAFEVLPSGQRKNM